MEIMTAFPARRFVATTNWIVNQANLHSSFVAEEYDEGEYQPFFILCQIQNQNPITHFR